MRLQKQLPEKHVHHKETQSGVLIDHLVKIYKGTLESIVP